MDHDLLEAIVTTIISAGIGVLLFGAVVMVLTL